MNQVSTFPLSEKKSAINYRWSLLAILLVTSFFFSIKLSHAQLSVTLESVVPSCGDFTDGKVNAFLDGGTAPYNILWNTGHDGLSLIGIGYGDYSITVTDANNDSTSASVTLTGPAKIEPVFSFTEEVCEGPPTDVFVEAVGGVPPYTYLWDNGSSDQERTDLDFATYCVTIEDAVGCRAAGCVTVPMAFEIRVTAIPPFCPAGCDGAATVEAFGGVAPYDILWSNGVTTSMNPMLLPGSYGVTVTDVNGCRREGVAKVPDGTGTLAVTEINVTNATCGAGGSIEIEAEGTNGGLTFMWNNGSREQNLSDLSAGTYKLTVTDRNGCKVSEEVVVMDNTDLAADITTQFICGDQFGSATATASGGTPPYTFAWNNGQEGPEAINLTPAEIYKVSVTDAAGCTVTKTAVITDFDELIVTIASRNPSCNGVPDAEASAVVNGVSGEFKYFWDGGQQRQTLTSLRGGTYSVTVFDENGCAGTASVTINDPDELDVDIEVINATCGELNSGAAVATVVGGTPPYSYSWTNGSNMPQTDGLDPGVHSILIRDSNGCEIFRVIEVEEILDVEISLSAQNADCGDPTGEAVVEIAGGTAPYSITWNTGSTDEQISNLGAGTYSVTVVDANNCAVEGEVDVTETSGITSSVEITNLDCAEDENGSIEVVITGGESPYSYLWSTGDTTANISDLSVGEYALTVEDANGCQVLENITVTAPPILILDVEKKNVVCGNDTGSALAMAFGGVGGFMYAWSTGDTGPEITSLDPGIYTVTVTDDNGCQAEASVEVTEVGEEVTASIQVDQMPTVDGNTGILTGIGSGGVEPYTYEWSTRSFSQTIENLPAGTYSVTIVDANSCFGVAEVELNALMNLTCAIEVAANLSNNGASDGILQVNATGGLAPYTYEWDDGSVTNTLEGIPAGSYNVTVTDANNQITTCSIEFPEVPVICINVDSPGKIGFDQQLCGPGNDPAELVNLELPTGGVGEIEYLWMKTTVPGPFDATTWENIPNSNSPSYDPGPVYETTYFARCARIEGCPFFLETSIITVEVLDVAVAEFVSAHVPICVDEPIAFEAFDNGPGATYLWNFGTNASPSTSNDITVDVTYMSKGIKRVTLTVEKDGCTSTNFLWVTVTDSPIYCGDGLEIEAEEVDEEVVIIWETEKEGNPSPPGSGNNASEGEPSFEVDRAAANQIFFPIDQVIEPYDSTATKYLYRYIDKSPLKGLSHYRVRFVDRWRNEFQSNEADVQRFDDELGEIFAYPNPFFQIFTIERVDFHTEEPISLEIRSASGQKVFITGLNEAELRKKIDMDLYSAGVYFVRVFIADEEVKTFRLVKINH